MKAILYVVALLAAGGAAYFTLEHTRKFEAVQTTRLTTIEDNRKVSANADATEKDLKDEKAVLATTETKREELTASISSLKSTGATLERGVAEVENEISAQAEEFKELEKALKEVEEILASLDDDINLDNLAEKIEAIEADKQAKIKSLEDKKTLIEGAEAALVQNREEYDRLVKRKIDRDARIGRNSMQAVITAVNQDWGFLVIGAGANSGFTPQTALTVKRDGRYLGRVRPSSIEPSQTIAEIDYDSLATGVRLQPGDQVFLTKPTSN